MWWVLSIFLFLPNAVIPRSRCGGVYTALRGTIQTPNFPQKFQVPIHCEWIIDAQHFHSENFSIIVYMTQLFIFEGLTFHEYQIYDQTYQLNGRVIHAVTESNVTKVSYVEGKKDFLVITLKLNTIESTHLRVLDHLLDVFGFNITYEITTSGPRSDRCTMIDCGFTGICFDHYNRFSCSCFPGYEGINCSEGPNSLCTSNSCKNGGTCVHLGDTAVRCECRAGYRGEHCETEAAPQAVRNCEKCFLFCPFDGREETVCKCPEGSNSTFSDTFMDYIATINLVNVPYQKPALLRIYAENQICRSVQDIISTLEDCYISNFESYQGYVVVTLGILGYRKDERRLKSAINKWSDRGHIGNLTLLPEHEIDLQLQPPQAPQSLFIQPPGVIYAGEDFILSCTAQAQTQTPTFRWFKDGIFINITSSASHKWEKVIEGEESTDRYIGLLGVKNASPFDQGNFVCQIVENGFQKCLSRRVDVHAAPRVWIEPMSLTVRKGENFTIKCFSVSRIGNDGRYNGDTYTYSWTKNRELLPIKTDTEHYEVLFPIGSILQVSTINKSTVFSCLVQDSPVWSEQSILVNVVDGELVKTCKGEKHLKLLWPETAPGTESLQECPAGYFGIARRACILRDTEQPTWQLPDFSGCTVEAVRKLDYEFQKLRLGYTDKNAVTILKDLRKYLQERHESLLPGEGARILTFVYEIIAYMNSSANEDPANTVLDIADRILSQRYSVVNQTQVILLQQVVKSQSLNFRSHFHRALSAIDVTSAPLDKTGFRIPLPFQRYPNWYSYKLHLTLPSQHYLSSLANKSMKLIVVVYKNLSAFLPQRSAIRLNDGSEMDYEIISKVATASLAIDNRDASGNLSDSLFTMEFMHPSVNASLELWKIVCGIADYASYGYSWNTQACITGLLESTVTRCVCPVAGTYAVLLTMKPFSVKTESIPVKHITILIGCFVCASLTIVTSVILSVYWYFRRSCLVFLKIQCCLSTFGSMVVFMYALWDELDSNLFLMVMSFLEVFLLTGLSSQLSKLLIVYSELVQLPRMRNVKETVVLIITGAPMIAVFGNHMTHLTMNTRINSWWLLQGSLSFNIFIYCASTIVVLYFVMFYVITKNMYRINLKYEKSTEPLKLRLELLKRSSVIFSSITILVLVSITYINHTENILYHYLFCGILIIVGGVIFFCYVLYSETSIKQVLITRLKDGNNKIENSDAGKDLHFYTKQKVDIENDSSPFPNMTESYFIYDPVCKHNLPEIGASTFKARSGARFETREFIAHSSHSSELQLLDESPKQFQQNAINSPDVLGTKTIVELDLIASSVDKSCEFLQDLPMIMITPVESEDFSERKERLKPEEKERFVHDFKAIQTNSSNQAETSTKIRLNLSDNESVNVSVKIDEKLDAVLNSITNDLDYLLNGSDFENGTASQNPDNANTTRRISRHPSLSVFEQIVEEPEEEIKVPDAITNVSRTSC